MLGLMLTSISQGFSCSSTMKSYPTSSADPFLPITCPSQLLTLQTTALRIFCCSVAHFSSPSHSENSRISHIDFSGLCCLWYFCMLLLVRCTKRL